MKWAGLSVDSQRHRENEVSGKGPRGKLERAKDFLAAPKTQMGLEIIILSLNQSVRLCDFL